jgi:hypothetical protein
MVVQLAPVDRVGPYVVRDVRTGQIVGGTYVDLDPAESDLATVTVGGGGVQPSSARIVPGTDGSAMVPRVGPPVELWPMLAGLAVALLALEQWLLWLWPTGAGAGARGVHDGPAAKALVGCSADYASGQWHPASTGGSRGA